MAYEDTQLRSSADPQGSPTTVVYVDSLAHQHRAISICLHIPPSSSPFPSPSSSFLPPPIPGNHEFAMRPPPSTRKASVAGGARGNANGGVNGRQEQGKTPLLEKGLDSSSMTSLEPPSTSLSESPMALPTQTPTSLATTSITNRSPSASTENNTPAPNRPVPPSPAPSRPVSSISTFSVPSRSRSRTPTPISLSRANSIRQPRTPDAPSQVQSPTMAASPVHTPVPRVPIHVRDFAYDTSDERFRGAGALVPRANRLAGLVRTLAGLAFPDEEEEEEEACGGRDGDDDGEEIDLNFAWDRLRGGSSSALGACECEAGAGAGAGGDEGCEGVEEPLYPGLYRALYAFEPEGTAEMALVEDQIVRVVGRGGGVGWAVVVDESQGMAGEPRHALVPESYLEVVRLDWEET